MPRVEGITGADQSPGSHGSLAATRTREPGRIPRQPSRAAERGSNGFTEADQLAIVNVAVQVERLARNPILAPALASGAVRIVGMFFDLSTGRVHEVDRSGIVCLEEPAGAQ